MPEETQFVTVRIESYHDAQRRPDSREILVDDADEVRRLASFFPELGQGKEAYSAAGDEAFAYLFFVRKDGSEARVSVNLDLTTWSEGRGDWDIRDRNAFTKFFLDLIRRGDAGPSS